MEKIALYGYLLFTTQSILPCFTGRDFTYLHPLYCVLSQTQPEITVVSVCRPSHAGRRRSHPVAVGPGPQLRVKRMDFEMAANGTDSGQFSKKHRVLGC